MTANSLNPGVVSTGIMRNFSLVVRGLFFLISPFIKVSGAVPGGGWGSGWAEGGEEGGGGGDEGAVPPLCPYRPWQSAEQGAVSTIYCAVSEEVSGISGKYFDSDCSLTLPSAAARDAGLARKLWEESERLTGLSS